MISKIGRYEIQSEIGSGGFGRVFKAIDSSLQRVVAIKLLTAMDRDLLERFRAEATATARLQHPNIVTIYEFGELENAPFIAMEYLEGEDLHRIIASQRRPTLLEKIGIMMQVARGLQHAHNHGVIHRDVKPANIRVLPGGDVKVMDFGIARVAHERDTRLTQQGSIVGTLQYMSPEQLKGQDADALSDIFSYGLTFYELLSGTNPFAAPDPASILYKITTEEPKRLSDIVPGCPPALDNVIAKTLAKDRQFRYQSLSDLLLDIQPVAFDLQNERSTELLREANDLLQSGQIVQAQSVTRKLLEIDPRNEPARKLFDAAQQSLRKLSTQQRIEATLKAAEALIAKSDFSEALSLLESAGALYPGNTELQKLLDQVLVLQQQQGVADRAAKDQRSAGMEPPIQPDRTVLVPPGAIDIARHVAPPAAAPVDFTRFLDKADFIEPLKAYVTVISCPDPFREGQTIPVKTPRFTIGRTESDLSFPEDKTLSRSHAVICWNRTGFTIEDAGATNGTYLNGARLAPGEKAPLPLNAELRLSIATRLRFRCDISELPDFTGQKLVHRYSLERCLRASRKSALYEGSDTRPVRKVAIKLLSPTLAGYPGYLEQFERESQSAAELSHPNICRIYEFGSAPLAFSPGEDRDIHYVCMQMLEGGSLAQRLDDPRQISPETIATWLDVVAGALDHAHRNGVVHSGLKPTSVVFNSEGVPYVTDFAIATRSKAAAHASPMWGAPDYLSPEQWDGLAAGPASDQYALACLCYRILTGVVPFENQIDHFARGRNFAQGAVPAHARAKEHERPLLRESISAVLAQALSLQPAERYSSVIDFAHAFRRSVSESTAPIRKPVVFVSYRREADAGWAALFADKLSTQHGLDVFVDRQRVDSARQVPEKIETAIRSCDFFVCLLAPTTLQSAWVREEIRIADAAGKPMIPVVQEGFRRPVTWNVPSWLRWLVPGGWLIPECAHRLMDAEEVRLFADYDQGAIEKLARMIHSVSHRSPK